MAEGTLPAGSPPGPGGQPPDDRAAGATAPSEAESGAVWRDNLYCVSVPPAGRRRLYRIHSQLFIRLDFDLDLPQSGRRGDDMVLSFDNGSEVVFEGFVRIADRDPTLHLLPPDGSLLPGDTVAAGLGALPGPPPALQTERPGAAGPPVHRDRAALPDETTAAPAVPADGAPDWPAQEILDDLQAKGLPVPAADAESGESEAPGEPPVSAADLVGQVVEALPDFGPGPEAAPAPQPDPEAPAQEEAAPRETRAEPPETVEPAPETFAPPPEPPLVEADAPAAEAAMPEVPPATPVPAIPVLAIPVPAIPVEDGTVWADALPGPDSAPAPEVPEPQLEAEGTAMPHAEEQLWPDASFQAAAVEEAPVEETPVEEAQIEEAAVLDSPVQAAPNQDGSDQATDLPPEADLPPVPPERAGSGLGDDVRFLPEQSLEDLLPPELLGQEPLPEALHAAPLESLPPEAPGAEAPCAPAAADPAAWASEREPEPRPPEPLPLDAPAAELAPQAAAEAVWEDTQSWPSAPQTALPPAPDEAPLQEAPQAEPVEPDLPTEAPAVPAAPPEILAESWDPAAGYEAAPLPDPLPEAAPPAPMPPPEALAACEPPVDSPVEPPVETPLEAAAEPVAPAAPALPDIQGGFYPAAAPFTPAEGHWQIAAFAAEAEVSAPVPPAAPMAFKEEPVEPAPTAESLADPAPEALIAPAEDPAAPETAEPAAQADDPAPALPDPEMVVKATQILAAFEQLSAVGSPVQDEPLAEAPELFAEEAQTEGPGPEDLAPEPLAPAAPADPAAAGLTRTDEALSPEPAAESESHAAALPESEAGGPQGQAGAGLLRSAVANVLRARSLILPGRGPEAGEEAADEEEALPADSVADGPQEGVLELTDSYEEPAPVEPQAVPLPASEAGGARAPDMNALDLFADPLGEDLPDLSGVPVGEDPPPKVPSFLTEPAQIETARRTGGKVKEIPAEVRDAVMVALHGMEEEDLFDFDGEARPPEAEAGQMVAVPIEGAARPVGVIFADKGTPEAPGGQEAEALPGAGESGQLPD